MVSRRFWLAVFVITLMFAITAVSCDDGSKSKDSGNKPETDPELNGTWIEFIYNEEYDYYHSGNMASIFNNGVIEEYDLYHLSTRSVPLAKGNYTTTREGSITITYTHLTGNFLGFGSSEWMSKDDIKSNYSSSISPKTLDELFSPHTYKYSITPIDDSEEVEMLTIGVNTYIPEWAYNDWD